MFQARAISWRVQRPSPPKKAKKQDGSPPTRANRRYSTSGGLRMIRVDVALKLGDFALDIVFENDAGIIALFGRSGSGKSMTINLIAGLTRPDRGSIVLDGRTLVDTEAGVFVPKHRRRVGLVFQD